MSKNVVLIRHSDDPVDGWVVSFFGSRIIEPEMCCLFGGI